MCRTGVHVGCACGVRGTLRKPGSPLHACVIQSCMLFNCNPNGSLVVSPSVTIGAADSQNHRSCQTGAFTISPT